MDRDAEAIALTSGQPISLVINGRPLPLTKGELSRNQIDGLVREIAPSDALERLKAGEEVTFSYTAPAGSITASVEPDGKGLRARLSPQASADATGPSAPATVSEPHAREEMDGLLRRLVEADGSDLHLRVGEPPILRLDGRLTREPGDTLVADQVQGMLEAIMPEKDRLQHDETGDADFAYEIEGVARFRVNAAVDRGGPMAVMRVIPTEIPTCAQMDLTPEVENLCLLSKGLVVITGPTGSGKSTTLAALIDKINSERDDHILTIEDPIEFVHKSKRCLVTHRQVGQHTKTFQSGLRAALREDPDIVLIGELRDLETVAIAIETAETGHLVFGTLHTTTASSTVDRIIDQFDGDRQAQIRVMLSESLRAVISQTLLRRVDGGRVAAREILLITSALSNLIREGKTFQIPSLIQTSRKLGMVTMTDALMELVDTKVVDPKEAYTKAVDKIALRTALQNRQIDTSFLAGH